MDKKLNILFIPRWYPNRLDPFNGIFIKRHAQAVALRHDVAVLYVNADPSMKGKTYELEFAEEDGIHVARVYYSNSIVGIPVLSSFIKFFRYRQACKMGLDAITKKRGRPDIVHIHVLSRTFIPAGWLKVPIVISEQWSGYLPEDGMYKGFLKKMLTRMAVKTASAVTTVSDSLKNAMLAHGLRNNYTVIPNVVDTNLFSPSARISRRDKFILLHVSNLDDRAKNVSGMIRSVKEVAETRQDFEFHIAGDGEGRRELERIARDAGLLDKHVFFLGAKKPDEVAKMMREADLFLLFSNYDNMPCVMVESMASGLPVIGSAIHGIGEHVQEGRGILVTAGDEHALAAAILKAMDNMSSFDKQKLNAYARKNFSYEAVSARFDEIYRKVLAN